MQENKGCREIFLNANQISGSFHCCKPSVAFPSMEANASLACRSCSQPNSLDCCRWIYPPSLFTHGPPFWGPCAGQALHRGPCRNTSDKHQLLSQAPDLQGHLASQAGTCQHGTSLYFCPSPWQIVPCTQSSLQLPPVPSTVPRES